MPPTKPLEPDCVLQRTLSNFLHKYPDICSTSSIAIAVSGGPDSMALADNFVKSFLGTIKIICVDHGLRDSAQGEIQLLQNWFSGLKKPYVTLDILTWQHDDPETAIMEKARLARYDLMADFCADHKIQHLFVAHHQDDQAETFLIRLIGGSGLDGLSAMSERQDYKNIHIMRPFLNNEKDDLIDYCRDHNVPFSHDPSNKNEKYLRPRLREDFPMLAEAGLTCKRLSATAKRLRRARNALEFMTDEAFYEISTVNNEDIILDYLQFQHYPEEIAFRLIQKSLEQFRFEQPYNVRMDKLENLFDDLWLSGEKFKARTLGGVKISLGRKKESVIFEKEK